MIQTNPGWLTLSWVNHFAVYKDFVHDKESNE